MSDVISLISEDESEPEEASAGAAAVPGSSSKRMRLIEPDSALHNLGKDCMQAWERHEAGEENVGCFPAGSMAAGAEAQYTKTIDEIQNVFAIEIAKREDELSSLKAQRDMGNKVVQDAASEIARLEAALKAQKSKADADLAAAVAAATAQAASSSSTARIKAETVLNRLIGDLSGYLTQKAASSVPTAASSKAPVPKASQPQAVVWIRQQNQDPQYLTVREIAYTRPAKNDSEGTWAFDNSDKKNNPNAPAVWVDITDSALIKELCKLGKLTPAKKIFTPKVGKSCTYKFGQHSYKVEVVKSVKPWVAAAAASAQAQPAPKATSKTTGQRVLLDGPHFNPNAAQMQGYQPVDTDEAMHEVVGHKALADLATQWSSMSYGFKYDPQKTELWVKPRWLATWLEMAEHRGDYEIRIVGHGVRSNDFDSLRKDPAGFNLAYSREGRVGFGCYVSPLDCIPADYTRSGGQNPDGSFKHPDGTMVLGLLLVNKQSSTHISTGTSGNSFQDRNGAYEFYHLGSSRASYLARDYTINDAYNVRDQTLLLPLGKIVAL